MRRAQMTLTAFAGPPRVWRRRHRWGELVRRSRSVADLTTRVADGLMTAETVLRALTSPRCVVAAWDRLLVAANTVALQMASHAAFPVDRCVPAVTLQPEELVVVTGFLDQVARVAVVLGVADTAALAAVSRCQVGELTVNPPEHRARV